MAKNLRPMLYIISLNVFFVLLPMLLLTYLYIRIIIKSKKSYYSFKIMFNLKKSSTDQLTFQSFQSKNFKITKFNSTHEISKSISTTALGVSYINPIFMDDELC